MDERTVRRTDGRSGGRSDRTVGQTDGGTEHETNGHKDGGILIRSDGWACCWLPLLPPADGRAGGRTV